MRISFRLNPEYDYELIKILKSYSDRNMSQLIRKTLRDNLKSSISLINNKNVMSNNASNTDNDKKVEETIINHVQDIDVKQINKAIENNKPIEIREVKKKIIWNIPSK